MAQIARDQAAQQLDEALKLKNALDQINPNVSHSKVGFGNLVITDQSSFLYRDKRRQIGNRWGSIFCDITAFTYW